MCTRYYDFNVGFSYWRGRKDEEVDMVADAQGRLVPFEVKYSHPHPGAGGLKGLVVFCTEEQIPRGVRHHARDEWFCCPAAGRFAGQNSHPEDPAPLACYWLGQSELFPTRRRREEG